MGRVSSSQGTASSQGTVSSQGTGSVRVGGGCRGSGSVVVELVKSTFLCFYPF